MKRFNIALFVLAAVLALYQLTNGQTVQHDTLYYPNGSVSAVYTFIDGGKAERRVYYPTGELMMIAEYDPATGNQHGDEYWYHRNSEVQESCTFAQGVCHGLNFGWDPFGNETFTRLYVQGKEVPVEDYEKYFPRDEFEEQPDVSGFARR
jgi:antitoxin component YwqK of YwqJK toxin-antitoxin module